MSIPLQPQNKEFNSTDVQLWLNDVRNYTLSGEIPKPTTTVMSSKGIILDENDRNILRRVEGETVLGLTEISTTPQISAGQDGQLLTIEGMNNDQKIALHNGDGLQLTGGNNIEIGLGDIIKLQYNKERDLWVELYRSIK
jgi:hypothetical protein